jgi:hypothetical protein
VGGELRGARSSEDFGWEGWSSAALSGTTAAAAEVGGAGGNGVEDRGRRHLNQGFI